MSAFVRRLQQATRSFQTGDGPVTHGSQITAANTGYTAYFDPGLGRNLQLSDLTVISGTRWVSDFIATGGTMTKCRFTGTLIIDIDAVTLRGCLFDNPVGGYLNGTHASGWTLDYCTIDPQTVGDQAIYYQGYTANRCYLVGCSDGAKTNGDNTIIRESYIRVRSQDSGDHNDGIQNVGGNGNVTIERCNIDARPTNGGGAPNAALFSADNATGFTQWHDNLVAGGGYVIRTYENCTFSVEGNWVIDGTYAFGPAARAIIPPSAVAWGTVRPNYLVQDGSYTILSTIAAP